jgi:hypothetical protein
MHGASSNSALLYYNTIQINAYFHSNMLTKENGKNNFDKLWA